MKKIAMLLCCLVPLLSFSQSKEIEFQTLGSWQQLLDKAKKENKKIFVDAYATWCGPCKEMDANVYTNSEVAEFVNENFIAVKVQIDQTKIDPEQIRRWYNDARELQKKYNIIALPTLLFIDSKGNQVFRREGFQTVENFLVTLKTAKDPKENYPNKIAKYKTGKLKGDDLRSLALQAKRYHDDSLAILIAKKYKQNVLDPSMPSKILSPKVLEYLYSFGSLTKINDPIVLYMKKYPIQADLLLGQKGYSTQMMDYLIVRDILKPALYKDGKITKEKPDWKLLEHTVATSYGMKTAKRLLLGLKAIWYHDQKDWPNYVKTSIEKQDFNGIDTSGTGKSMLNNLVYNVILKYSNDPVDLNRGLDYMKIALENKDNDDASFDTYANVLYKLGRKNEALVAEGHALTLAEERKDERNIKFYKETIEKMKSDLPVPVE